MNWVEIYKTLRQVNRAVKENIMAGQISNKDYHSNRYSADDAWEEVCELERIFSNWDGDNSEQFVRSLINEAMLEEDEED